MDRLSQEELNEMSVQELDELLEFVSKQYESEIDRIKKIELSSFMLDIEVAINDKFDE